jgi:hypothetical protein
MFRHLAILGSILALTAMPLSVVAADHGDVLWITPLPDGSGYVNHVPGEWCRKDGVAAYCWGSNGHGNTVGIVFGKNITHRACYIDFDYLNKVPHLRGVRGPCTGKLVGKQIRVY